MDEKKETPKCPKCNNDMKLSIDSMLTIHRCTLRFHCNHCDTDWDLSKTREFTEVPKRDPEHPCRGCWNNAPGFYHEMECNHCTNGSNYRSN